MEPYQVLCVYLGRGHSSKRLCCTYQKKTCQIDIFFKSGQKDDHFGHVGQFTQFTSPDTLKFTSSDSRKAPCRTQDSVSRYPPPQHPRHQDPAPAPGTKASPLTSPPTGPLYSLTSSRSPTPHSGARGAGRETVSVTVPVERLSTSTAPCIERKIFEGNF